MTHTLKLLLRYKKNGETFETDLNDKAQKHVGFRVSDKDGRIRVFAEPFAEIELLEARMTLPVQYVPHNTVYLNGYQTWTDSKEHGLKDPIPPQSKYFWWLTKKFPIDMSGDYTFVPYRKNERLYSFSYTYVRERENYRLLGSMSEREGFTIFFHHPESNEIVIKKDVEGKTIDDLYLLFDILDAEGGYDEVFDRWFAAMQIVPRTTKKLVGYTSWYNHYQGIDEAKIEKDFNASVALKEVKYDIFQIDDGYQTAVGDWLSIDPKKFPRGMKRVADEIHEKGMLAGIWLAPFTAEKKSLLLKEHPDWFIKKPDGSLQPGGMNWSGMYTLDIELPEVREHLRHVFDVVLNEWGYDMVKLDFLYSACIIPIHNKTRGQLMTEGMEFLREIVGDKLLLGCGVPLFPAFGVADYCRIGADISLSWDSWWMDRLMHRERVSTKFAIYNSVYRRHLDGRAFGNDTDVFLLRDANMTMTEEQKLLLGDVVRLTGSVLFNSDDVSTYDDAKLSALKRITLPNDAVIKRVYEPQKNVLTVEYTENGVNRILTVNMKKGKKIS